MILDRIKIQENDRWYLDEELYDRLVYRSNFVSDPFAAIELVLVHGANDKVKVLLKSEACKQGMEMFFQKEIEPELYLNLVVEISELEMFFNYIV